jgi:RNA polymerase sigma-70 factor (ECF subfamily)
MIADERLGLMFACCHPALAREAQIPLTLRLVGGLTVAEIARALLLPEPTIGQRLVRAERKLRLSGIPIAKPPPDAVPARLDAVLAVLYLIFNEGYAATAGDELVREDLGAEAIRLARILHPLLPDEPEPAGLLALMLLQHSRRAARVGDQGDLVLLEAQDRSRWDREAIEEALPLVDLALTLRPAPGSYALQAAIAAVHASAERHEDTDWRQIALLYAELANVLPTPVVTLNRAIAIAMADGPAAGLALVDALASGGALDHYHLLHAARADLLRREGRRAEAATAYRRALALATNEAERRFLAGRLDECRR